MHISTMNYNIRRVVDKKTSKPGHHLKGAITGQTSFLYIVTKKVKVFIQILHYFTAISDHSIGKIPSQ